MRSKNVVKREAVLLTTAGVSGLTTHLAGVGWGRDGRNGRDHDWILLGEIIAAVDQLPILHLNGLKERTRVRIVGALP